MERPVINQELVPETQVREALARMTASEMFRDSPQLSAFLRFVTEAQLRGESDRIKGYMIGVEALGRGKDFDPQTDPIVRVEATRLRRTIERYYAGPGARDPVIVSLSPGSYVPTFRWRKPIHGTAVRSDVSRRSIRRGLAAVVVLAVMTLALGAYFFMTRHSIDPFSSSLPPGNGMPTVLLEQLAVAGTPLQDVVPQIAITEKLRDAISRFDTLNAMLSKEVQDAEQSGVKRPIRFRLTGFIEYRDDGAPNLRFQLFDAEDNTLVWSRVFERFAAKGSRAVAEDAVVTEVVTAIGQPFGVVRAHERNRYLAGKAVDPRYLCILETSESLRSFDPEQHRRAKSCLETLIKRDPSFASGYAYLGVLWLREYQFGIGARGEDPLALDRALSLLRQSIEKNPESARGYQILSAVLYGRRDYEAALAAAERAVTLNRYDMTALSDYGGRLVMGGEVDKGLALLQQAGSFGTLRPSWYNFYFFLAFYLKDDMAAASHYASQITPERYPLGHVAHALSSHAAGNKERTRDALDKLVALRASWRDNAQAELEKLIASRQIAARLAKDLADAGLGTTHR